MATGKILTGIDPIDKTLGGLEPGRCHLVVGKPNSGKTTLCAQFLATGLKNNERVVIFTRGSAEDVVNRLAQLGYDYFAHIPAGHDANDQVAIFAQSDDTINQIRELDDFSLVVGELEETIKYSNPTRTVFDPTGYLVEAPTEEARYERARALVNLLNRIVTTSILVVDEVAGDKTVAPLAELCHSVFYLNSKSSDLGISILDIAKAENEPVKRPEILVSVNNSKGLTTFFPAEQKQTPTPAPPPNPAQTGAVNMADAPTAYAPVKNDAVAKTTPLVQPVGTQVLPPIELESPAASKFHVLVIDDDPATCNLITRALRQDCDVTAVNDGASGLKKLSSNSYDLIILDVNLPVVDGFHICQHIRKTQWQVPIIIVTGTHLRAEDRLHSASAGGDLYLTKPFSVHELRLRVRQMIGRYRNVPEWVGAGAGIGLEAALSESVSPETEEQFVGYDAFVQRLSRHTERARAVGLPFSIVGCTIVATNGGANKASRMIDAVRYQIRERDVMTVTPEHQSFVLLSEANVDGVQVFVQRLRQSIVAEVGADPLIQWRTYPIDGENAGDLLTEVREDLRNEILAIERESATATEEPAEVPESVSTGFTDYENITASLNHPDPIAEVVNQAHPSQAASIMHDAQPASEEQFFEFVIEEEEIVREGDQTMSNMGAHVPANLVSTPPSAAVPENTAPRPAAPEPVREPEPVSASKADSQGFSFSPSEAQVIDMAGTTPMLDDVLAGLPPANQQAAEQAAQSSETLSKEPAIVWVKPETTKDEAVEKVGSVSQSIPEILVNSATQEIPQEFLVVAAEPKTEPKVEWVEPQLQPVAQVRVPDVERDPTIEPISYIPAPQSIRPTDFRTTGPMWTETPRSASHSVTGEVPAFATFFDNSFEQYRQIVESLNQQPVAVERPVQLEAPPREAFLQFLAGRN